MYRLSVTESSYLLGAVCDSLVPLSELTKPPQPEHHLVGIGPLKKLAAKLSECGLTARVEVLETESIISLTSPNPENISDGLGCCR